MDKNALWKWLILIALVAGSLVTVTPPRDKLKFGLDLKGGISFVVTVDEAKIEQDIRDDAGEKLDEDEIRAQKRESLKDAQERSIEVLRNRLNRLGIEEPSIVAKADRIEIQLPGVGEEKREDAEHSILSVGYLEFRIVAEKSAELIEQMQSEGKAPEGYRIVTVEGRSYYKPTREIADTERDEEFLAQLGRFNIPNPNVEFMLEEVEVQKRVLYRAHFVNRRPVLRSRHLANSSLGSTGLNMPCVNLTFTPKGAKRFGKVTSDYAPGGPLNPEGYRQLAIVIDGTLYSAPRINEPIFGGRAQITGSFSRLEAKRLVNVLRSGALPTRVKIEEKRYVAPSLGAASIKGGIKSVMLGGIGVLLFMLVYYLLSGLVANIALLLNMLLLPLGMVIASGFLGMGRGAGGSAISLPVLTLPGIAGILLTIGMAVDANVLIFERIREETKLGKRLWTAITAGYDRAFVTILDANITTLMVGVILFVLGSGPIRGFAVTLCAGIMVSMYTALVITKLLFAVIASKTKISGLKMLSIIGQTKVDFIGKRKVAALFSLLVILLSCGLLVGRAVKAPGEVFGVDFTGGSAVTFKFDPENKIPTGELADALDAAGVTARIQYEKELDSNVDTTLQVKTGVDLVDGQKPAEVIKTILIENYPESAYTVAQEDEVGSQIGKELKKSAIWSIIAALLGIIIYISWRFELGFAIGAIVALAHDVLVTVGVYSLSGHQISLPIVAALLTIVGYSVNDTIVVFDRIREDLKLVKKSSFKDICNLSINQTLSRTLLTSFTTLITVVMLLVFGGGAIFDFALALCIGVLVGTYSSIFVATPVVLLWHKDKKPEFAKTAAQV